MLYQTKTKKTSEELCKSTKKRWGLKEEKKKNDGGGGGLGKIEGNIARNLAENITGVKVVEA